MQHDAGICRGGPGRAVSQLYAQDTRQAFGQLRIAAKIYVRLQQGKSGLYLAEPEKGVLQMTAFGVIFNNAPNPVPANGFNWRRATVFYLTLNREQPNPVSKLDFTLSGDGLVTLDTINNNWQIGWGPVATRYTVPRAEKP